MHTKYIASVSFGKDSLAMLLLIIENKYPLDEVVFFDTGMEFQAIYNIRDKIKKILNELNIKYTELKPDREFIYDMLEKPVKKRNGQIQKGYGWCGGPCRWGTTYKTRKINQYTKGNFVYVGIAIDESKRLKRAINKDPLKKFPLVELGMTENDCLEYCYKKGYDWKEGEIDLYDILKRVSCWCCANKNIAELRNYYTYLPHYFKKLKDFQSQINRNIKPKYSMFDLENKFKQEERRTNGIYKNKN